MKSKKMFAILLALMLLPGCSKAAVSGGAPTAAITDCPKKMDLFCYDAFRDGLTTDYAAIDEWVTYMESVYPMEITLANNVYPCTYSVNFGDTTTGLACLQGKHILPLIKGEKLLPLEEYLKDNKVWISLPEEFRNQFELDGHIWAIPYSERSTLKVAYIRTDWLKAVGLNVPTTIKELMAVGKAFAEGDPNGNGIADDYLLGGLPSTGFCQQILNSMGFYIDSEQLSVAYDPVEGCIVDSMFKPEAKEAIQLLRDMVTGGMIDPLSFTDPTAAQAKNNNGEYGIANASVIDGKYTVGINWTKANAQKALGREYDPEKQEDYQYATGLYEALPLFSSEYPVTYQSSLSGYAMAVGTAQPKETINTFVNMVFGSRKSFLELYMGDPGHYTVNNNVVTLKYQDEETKTPYLTAHLTDLPQMMIGRDYMVINSDSSVSQGLQNLNEARQSEKEAYERDYLKRYGNGQLAEIPAFYEIGGTAYETGGRWIYEKFRTSMNALNDPSKTVDNIILGYKDIANFYLEDILTECNANMGLQNKQKLY